MSTQPNAQKTDYRSFMVRFTRQSEQPNWQITVRRVQSQSSPTLHFASLAELVAYLADEMQVENRL